MNKIKQNETKLLVFFFLFFLSKQLNNNIRKFSGFYSAYLIEFLLNFKCVLKYRNLSVQYRNSLIILEMYVYL